MIFDRIKNIARAYWTDATTDDTAWAERILDSDDEELRRIIDELNSGSAGSTQERNRQRTQQAHRASTPNVPADVMKACAILGIAHDDSVDAVKKAYRAAIYKVHPDRVATGTAAEQQTAARKTQELNAAYQVMKIYRRFN